MSKAKAMFSVSGNKCIIEFKDFDVSKDTKFVISNDRSYVVLDGDEQSAKQVINKLKLILCSSDLNDIINDYPAIKDLVKRIRRIADPSLYIKTPKTIRGNHERE